MEVPKPKTSKAVALWVITGILAVSCGAYALFLQSASDSANSQQTAQEKPAPQSQNKPQTRDESSALDDPDADDSNSAEQQQTPPVGGMQAPVGGHNMGAPPDAPPLKDVKQP